MTRKLAFLLALLALPASAADQRISDVPLASSLTGFETLPIILQDNLTMRRATVAQIAAKAAWNQWKGAWSSSATYSVNDVVSNNGASYIAIAASTNQAPPNASYWNVIAAKGADGAGSGTVTSITCGAGLSGGVVTLSGTCAISAPIPVNLGGTNATSASGTALDNITGWASTGFIKRTGSGSYAFVADPLPVVNGGLGIATGVSGGLPCFTASTTISSSSALGQYALMTGGGAGVCPVTLGSLGTTTTLLHGNASGLPAWGALAYADIASAALATSSEFRANTASKLLTPGAVWSGAQVVALTDAATIAVDMSTGVNFSVTLAASRSLGGATNAKPGQTGVIRIAQDATGSRTLSYNAIWKFAAGTACVLSTGANKVDYLFYFVYSASEIFLNCVLDVR